MNLEPIYLFFKEEVSELSSDEKQFLKLNLLSEFMRKEIIEEYPEEDIINATIKYYVKNTIMKYFFLLRDVRENKEKYQEQFKKVEELSGICHSFLPFCPPTILIIVLSLKMISSGFTFS